MPAPHVVLAGEVGAQPDNDDVARGQRHRRGPGQEPLPEHVPLAGGRRIGEADAGRGLRVEPDADPVPYACLLHRPRHLAADTGAAKTAVIERAPAPGRYEQIVRAERSLVPLIRGSDAGACEVESVLGRPRLNRAFVSRGRRHERGPERFARGDDPAARLEKPRPRVENRDDALAEHRQRTVEIGDDAVDTFRQIDVRRHRLHELNPIGIPVGRRGLASHLESRHLVRRHTRGARRRGTPGAPGCRGRCRCRARRMQA